MIDIEPDNSQQMNHKKWYMHVPGYFVSWLKFLYSHRAIVVVHALGILRSVNIFCLCKLAGVESEYTH